ncbi:hypothetical protein, partial [Staphylococcus argenteus]|uniref:hypothetical protein n=1 Tax=Staphylococcus argenteus TaxID=985002 RepID=UPI001C4CBDE3
LGTAEFTTLWVCQNIKVVALSLMLMTLCIKVRGTFMPRKLFERLIFLFFYFLLLFSSNIL